MADVEQLHCLKVNSDHRSKFSNLSNWKEEVWKNQGFYNHSSNMNYFLYTSHNNIVSRDLNYFQIITVELRLTIISLKWSPSYTFSYEKTLLMRPTSQYGQRPHPQIPTCIIFYNFNPVYTVTQTSYVHLSIVNVLQPDTSLKYICILDAY